MAKIVLIDAGKYSRYSMRFPSQTAFHALEKDIRNNAALGEPFDGLELIVALYVLQCHPGHRAMAMRDDVSYIAVYENPAYPPPSRSYCVVYDDGTRTHYSREYCEMIPAKRLAHHTENTPTRVAEAARRAVMADVLAAKQARTAGRGVVTCEACGDTLPAYAVHMHHHPDKFRDIFDGFFTTMPRLIDDGPYRVIADPVLKARWIDYHRLHARYMLTCEDCNAAAERGDNHHSRDHLRRSADVVAG